MALAVFAVIGQALLNRTLSNETQRPSAEKLWQMPGAEQEPSDPFAPARSLPLEVQATSYLAASARIVSLSQTSKWITSI